MIRRDVLIIALLTFCLTSILFMATTTRSQVGEYNPWADYNEDGVIDVFDIVPGGAAYGTEGDPTKNVYVTNWPYGYNVTVTNLHPASEVISLVENLNVTWDTATGHSNLIDLGLVFVGDYSRAKIYLIATNCTATGAEYNYALIRVYVYSVCDYFEYQLGNSNANWASPVDGCSANTTVPNTIQQMNVIDCPYYRITIQGISSTGYTPKPSHIPCLVSLGIYLRNE